MGRGTRALRRQLVGILGALALIGAVAVPMVLASTSGGDSISLIVPCLKVPVTVVNIVIGSLS